jgi:hypothetical protein
MNNCRFTAVQWNVKKSAPVPALNNFAPGGDACHLLQMQELCQKLVQVYAEGWRLAVLGLMSAVVLELMSAVALELMSAVALELMIAPADRESLCNGTLVSDDEGKLSERSVNKTCREM